MVMKNEATSANKMQRAEKNVTSVSSAEKLWSYLFRNATQALNELLDLCASEQSVHHCEEAEQLLSEYCHLFGKLYLSTKGKHNFQKSPGGVAWEVCKSESPFCSSNSTPHSSDGTLKKMKCLSFNNRSLSGGILMNVKDFEEKVEQLTPVCCSYTEINGNNDSSESVLVKDDRDCDTADIPEIRCSSMPPEPIVSCSKELSLTVEVPSLDSFDGCVDVEDSYRFDKHDGSYSCSHRKTPVKVTKLCASDSYSNTEDDYAIATEKIFAEAEAWVDAASKAEDDAWREFSSNSSSEPIDRSEQSQGAKANVPSHLELHRKLLSPERKKPTPEEAKQKHEQRQQTAQLNRESLAIDLQDKFKARSLYADQVKVRQREKLALAQEFIKKRMDNAEARREAHLTSVVKKANDESCKVNEVMFINKLTVEDWKVTIEMKLREVEKKIFSGRMRRQHHLVGIEVKQRSRHREKAATIVEHQLFLDKEIAVRWEKLQTRLETVQRRRSERLAEIQRHRVATERAQREAKGRRDAMLQEMIQKVEAKNARWKAALLNEKKSSFYGKHQLKEISDSTALKPSHEEFNLRFLYQPPSKGMKKKARRARGHLKRCTSELWHELPIERDIEDVAQGITDADAHQMEVYLRILTELSEISESVLGDIVVMLRDIPRDHIKLQLIRTSGVLDRFHVLLKLCQKTLFKTGDQENHHTESISIRSLKCLELTLVHPANVLHSFLSQQGCAHIVDLLALSLAQRGTDIQPKMSGLRCFLDAYFGKSALAIIGSSSRILSLLLRFDERAVQTNKKLNMAKSKDALIRYIFARGLVSSLYCALYELHAATSNLKESASDLSTLHHLLEVLASVATFVREVRLLASNSHDSLEQAVISGFDFSPSLTLLSAMLLSLSWRRQDSPPVAECSEQVFLVALTSFKCIEDMSSINLRFVQESLSSKATRTEFLSTCDLLLERTNDTITKGTATDVEIQCLESVIRVLGAFTSSSQENQDMLMWGAYPCILNRLCRLPYQYFFRSSKHVLLPTLISASYRNKRAVEVLTEDVSAKLLVNYVDEMRRLLVERSADSESRRAFFPPDSFEEIADFYFKSAA